MLPLKRLYSFLLPAALLLCFALFACSSGSGSAASRGAASRAALGGSKSAAGTGGTAEGGNRTAEAAVSAQPSASGGSGSGADSRKVVKSAELSLQTVRCEESAAKFEALVASFGGYIESSSVQGKGAGGGSGRAASYTARLPADRLDEFLGKAGEIGSVVNRSVRGEDVTQSYFDSETRLKTLRAEQERILALMDKAEKIEDVIKIEERLTRVQTEIEKLTGELKRFDSLISLSTVTVTIAEVQVAAAPENSGFGGQLLSMLRTSVFALGRFFRYALLGVTAVLPFAAAAAAVLAAVFLIRGRLKKKKG